MAVLIQLKLKITLICGIRKQKNNQFTSTQSKRLGNKKSCNLFHAITGHCCCLHRFIWIRKPLNEITLKVIARNLKGKKHQREQQQPQQQIISHHTYMWWYRINACCFQVSFNIISFVNINADAAAVIVVFADCLSYYYLCYSLIY